MVTKRSKPERTMVIVLGQAAKVRASMSSTVGLAHLFMTSMTGELTEDCKVDLLREEAAVAECRWHSEALTNQMRCAMPDATSLRAGTETASVLGPKALFQDIPLEVLFVVCWFCWSSSLHPSANQGSNFHICNQCTCVASKWWCGALANLNEAGTVQLDGYTDNFKAKTGARWISDEAQSIGWIWPVDWPCFTRDLLLATF